MSVHFNKYYAGLFLLLLLAGTVVYFFLRKNETIKEQRKNANNIWQPPDTTELAYTPSDRLIRYGRALITGTASFLGPKGTIAHISNGMNCQNCHLDAGTRSFGNNFALVASTYPVFRDRSGRMESIEFRINECLQRSLNGKKIDSLSDEMRAMVAYIKWVGKDVIKGTKPTGTGFETLSFLERPADSALGRLVYFSKCKVCHGDNGQGQPDIDSIGYNYPPLWGDHSFNVSAGMYRISHLANFVKHNMPYTITTSTPQLSNEEAWDVAAFVISQQRPKKFFSFDWPDINTKPIDYPFKPYADNFSELQHKFGPFGQIKNARAALKKNRQ